MDAFDIFVGMMTVGVTERERETESAKWMFVRERDVVKRMLLRLFVLLIPKGDLPGAGGFHV
jgi:hypothetical protein